MPTEAVGRGGGGGGTGFRHTTPTAACVGQRMMPWHAAARLRSPRGMYQLLEAMEKHSINGSVVRYPAGMVMGGGRGGGGMAGMG